MARPQHAPPQRTRQPQRAMQIKELTPKERDALVKRDCGAIDAVYAVGATWDMLQHLHAICVVQIHTLRLAIRLESELDFTRESLQDALTILETSVSNALFDIGARHGQTGRVSVSTASEHEGLSDLADIAEMTARNFPRAVLLLGIKEAMAQPVIELGAPA